MTFLNRIPGPLLIFLGATCLSFGGLIVKSFEGANLWQILFWRQTFFAIIVAFYLLFRYKKNFFKSFYNSGLAGLIAGFVLSIGFSAYVFAMYNTTVANTNFIITTETIFLAVFGYFFLKEKINLITFISIILGMSGVLLIVGSSLSIQSSEQFIGNIVAFIMPISFAILVIIIRKYPNVDMVPAQFTAGIIAAMPESVLGGAAIIMFGLITAAGIKLISQSEMSQRNLLILALSLSFGIGMSLLPQFVAHIPDFGIQFKLLLTTGLIPAGILAFILNATFPKK